MSNEGYAVQHTRRSHLERPAAERKGRKRKMKKGVVLGSDFLFYKVDECSDAKTPNVLKEITTKKPGCGYEVGDMVWGKVESHPWWPGQILDEGFAEPAARRTKREGHVLVSFYGDDSYGWFDPVELIPFDSHYAEKSKQTNADAFVRAVEEAVIEVTRRVALRVVCNCCMLNSFLATSVEGFYSVHVNGYKHRGLYSAEQIKRARDEFQPIEMHLFVCAMAVMPNSNAERSIDCIKNVSTILAYRKVVFEEIDEPYFQAFGVPICSGHSMGVSGQQEKVSSQELSTKGLKRLRGLKSLEVGKKYGNLKPLEARGGNPKEMNTMSPAKPMSNSKLGAVISVAEPVLDRKVMSSVVLTKPINDKKLEAWVQTVEPSMGQKDMSTVVSRKPINEKKLEARVQIVEPTMGRKEMSAVVPRKPINDEKLEEAQIEVTEPTMLVMKFPPETTLPSIPELKAKFVRFGPLHPSAACVFWSSSTCRVVFKYRHDAQEAHAFASQNSSFFGSVKVNYHLRAYELPASELPESGKMVLKKTSNVDPILKSTNVAATLTFPSSRIPNLQEHSEVGHLGKAPTMEYNQPEASCHVHTSAPHPAYFSRRMLDLMKRCEDTVGRIKSQGYNTYQPL